MSASRHLCAFNCAARLRIRENGARLFFNLAAVSSWLISFKEEYCLLFLAERQAQSAFPAGY